MLHPTSPRSSGLLAWSIMLAWIVACSTAPPPDATTDQQTHPAAPAAEPTWQQVKHWTGSGIKETESFTTASREWRIVWKTTNEAFAGAGVLQIYVYDAQGTLLSLAANKTGIGNDTSYVRAPPGSFYLTINSGNVDWDVTVEDQR